MDLRVPGRQRGRPLKMIFRRRGCSSGEAVHAAAVSESIPQGDGRAAISTRDLPPGPATQLHSDASAVAITRTSTTRSTSSVDIERRGVAGAAAASDGNTARQSQAYGPNLHGTPTDFVRQVLGERYPPPCGSNIYWNEGNKMWQGRCPRPDGPPKWFSRNGRIDDPAGINTIYAKIVSWYGNARTASTN